MRNLFRARPAGRLLFALLAVVFAATACSSSDDGGGVETAAPTETETADPTAGADDGADGMADDDMAEEMDGEDMAEEGHDHDHGDGAVEVTWSPVPSMELSAVADPAAGWNVHAMVADFAITPEHASTDPVDGEGHLHIYVDGTKIGRMYGEWFHLPALGPGDHEIRVELSANNHLPLAVDGIKIDATVTVTEAGLEMADDDMAEEMDGDDMDHDMAGEVIEVRVQGSTVTGGGRHAVSTGDHVTLVVRADVADHVHVHGYDLLESVSAGGSATLEFTADLPGVWEIELEEHGLVLVELEVS